MFQTWSERYIQMMIHVVIPDLVFIVMGINLGSLIAPIIVPWASNQWNFHIGFSLAAVGMFIGLIVYWYDGKKYLPDSGLKAPDPITESERSKAISRLVYAIIAVVIILAIMFFTKTLTVNNIINIISALGVILPIIYFVVMLRSKKVSKTEKSRVWAYIPLFIAAVVFWAIEEQGSVVMALLVAEQTQLHFAGWTLQPGWFQTLNPFFIVIYTPFFAWLWIKLGKRQPSSPSKFWLGLVFTAASYFLLLLPLSTVGNGKISPLWLVGQWALIEIGEMLVSPVGMSATTKLAPKAFKSQMMSMWFLADSCWSIDQCSSC